MTSNPSSVLAAASESSSTGGFLIVVMFIGLLIWSLRWVHSDAEARGKDGCWVAFLVCIISWPIGLLIWIAFRPDLKASIRANHSQNRCSHCKAPIERGRALCPRCTSLA
jgi:hypothetical protein